MIGFKQIGRCGRFGNQMFQYASLLALAKDNNFEYSVAYSNNSSDEYSNFILPDAFDNLSAKDCSNTQFSKVAIENIGYYNDVYDPNIKNLSDNMEIFGYFQSEKYFKHRKSEICKEFAFKNWIVYNANLIRNEYSDECISVHIRLGDYLKQQHNHPICSQDYYKKAFDILPKNKTILLFSDNLPMARNLLGFIDNIVPINTNCKFTDMALMNMCEYHVIANSSFSWWGAWLSNSKTVIAPEKWHGSNSDYGIPKAWPSIYCENWIVI
jgi:hypothetical protein